MSTFTYATNAGDCWGANGTFSATQNYYYMGNQQINNGNSFVWIPFVVADIGKYVTITSATITWTANESRNDNTVSIKLGCEAADNPINPANFTDLSGRVLTAAYNTYNLANYTLGTAYSYDVTNAVQEILNRSGWVAGNTLAILVQNNGTIYDKRRRVASFEDTTYAAPQLVIVADSFVPRGGVI